MSSVNLFIGRPTNLILHYTFVATNSNHESEVTIQNLQDKISELEEYLMTNIPKNIRGKTCLDI